MQSGRFGACLMAEPDLVAELVSAMRAAVSIPVTVKSRIAIDEMEEWPTLEHFVGRVREAGCTRFIVHARKAWLKGLSPTENRDIPPLRYELVHRLKRENPDLDITINGGITTLDQAAEHLALRRWRHAGPGRVQEPLGAGGGRPAFLSGAERIGDSTATKWCAGCCLTLRRGGSRGHL